MNAMYAQTHLHLNADYSVQIEIEIVVVHSAAPECTFRVGVHGKLYIAMCFNAF